MLPNQRFTVKDLGILARRGAMGAVSPLRRPADRRTTWLTSSWSRTGVAEPRMLLQEATPTLQLASLGETGAAAQGNHSDVRLTSSWRRTGVAAAETPELNANSSIFSHFSKSFGSVNRGITPVIHFEFSANHTGNDVSGITAGVSPVVPQEVASRGITPAVPQHEVTMPTEFTLMGIATLALLAFISMTICHMMSPGGGETNHRVPPRWGPERETTYSFKTYVTDLMLWSMLTDLAPHQQVAAIILRLEGAARELARTLTPQEITQGGMINGIMVDPVSYIVYGLHARFAQLGEESRLVAMTEMLSFSRGPRESINEVLTRYEIVRQRARLEGQFVMSTEGCALQLLRACGVNTTQLMQLLQPFGTNLPRNEQELSQMANSMRRMGHILENSPGNIASSLRGNRTGGSHLLADVFVSMDSEQAVAYQSSQGWTRQEGQQDIWRNLTPAPESAVVPYDQYPTGSYPQAASSSWEGNHQEDWNWGNSGITAETPEHAYLGNMDDPFNAGYDTGTDSETSSDSGHEEMDMSDLHGMDDSAASEHCYWQYRQAKRRWRRLTNKPVRKFRRLTRKFRRKGKGKGFRSGFRSGKGFGKSKGIFLAEEHEAALTYLKGKGKGKRKGSSGKGTGRRKNPTGRDGQVMRCRVCGSDEHFAARCPQSDGRPGGGSSSAGPQMFVLQESSDGPLSGLLQVTGDTNLPLEYPGRSSLNFLALRTNETPEDPLTQNDPWQSTGSAGSASGNSHFGPSQPRSGNRNARRPGLRAPGETSSGAPAGGGFVPAAPAAAQQSTPGANYGGSAFMQEAHSSGGFTTAQPPPAPPVGQTVVNSGNPNLTDTQLQHLLTSHQMAGDLRTQHREHVRGRRAMDSNAPLNSLPTVFQQMAAMGPGPLAMGTAVPIPGTGIQSWVQNDSTFMQSQPVAPSLFTGWQNPTALQETLMAVPPPPPVPMEGVTTADQAVVVPPPPPQVIETLPEEEMPLEPLPQAPTTPVIFDGDNRSCTICIQDFEHGQRVVRVRCRHVFHGDCWMAVHLAHANRRTERTISDIPECPNCRGVGDIIALWDFIDPEHITQPGATNLLEGDGLDQLRGRPSEPGTSTPTRPRSESQWGTPDSNASRQQPYRSHRSRSTSVRRPDRMPEYLVLPSTYLDASDWSVQDQVTTPPVTESDQAETYHSGTRMPDGRPVLLIDPGSVGNLSGDRWARECAQVAIQNGKAPSEARRPRPLSVMGVGNGNQTCTHNCTLPIGLIRSNGSSHDGTFTTPVVANSDLPGLLGLHTMRRNRCVLDMVNLQLHMCGPDEVQLSVPTGTESFQLEIAPSGHLVLPCGNYSATPPNRLNTPELVLQTTAVASQLEPASSSSSSGVNL